jgi:hypothetical protein
MQRTFPSQGDLKRKTSKRGGEGGALELSGFRLLDWGITRVSVNVARGGNLVLATLAGLAAAFVAAIAWGAITVATHYRIGFMAIGVGLLVAFAVRYAGGGHDSRFAYVSGALSLLGCVAGNYFAACALFATDQHLDVLRTVAIVTPHIAEFMKDTFRPMDLLFYAIGAYFGFKYAMVPLQRAAAPAMPAQPPPDPGQP